MMKGGVAADEGHQKEVKDNADAAHCLCIE